MFLKLDQTTNQHD